MAKIIDCITFNGEHELFEIRYNILKDYVDEFRVIEFDRTFSGKKKEKKFNQNWEKVKHYFIKEEQWIKYWDEAKKSPNTNYGEGAKHWIREWCMKESIKDFLIDLKDDDIIMVGDVDEIINPKYISHFSKYTQTVKLGLIVYTYYLNNRSSEEFWGTLLAVWKNIKNECLNHLRASKNLRSNGDKIGWHFTSMGGYDKVKDKLQDSYTEETYANKGVLTNLEDNIKLNKDFLGRDFKYKVDESEWPEWLKKNKNKYKHLLK